MKRELQGKYVVTSTVGEKAEAFVPSPLPPCPPVEWTNELRHQFDKTSPNSKVITRITAELAAVTLIKPCFIVIQLR